MDDSDKIPHRGHEVLEVLARFGGSARNAQIAHALGVSEETVRRLVRTLAQAGKVERVHGGTYLSHPQDAPIYSSALEKNATAKSDIARKAAALIADKMTVFLNVGSTTTYVAEQLRRLSGLTVVTNSIPAIASLAGNNGSRVFLTGGEVMRAERGSFGRTAEALAQQFSYDALIVGADGVSPQHGFVTGNALEADLTRAIAGQAERVIVVADLSKLNKRAPFVACPPALITDFVTERDPDPALADALARWGITTHAAIPAMTEAEAR
ncbi:DeoR/GlpR family DNA-binding transcription regulator [Phaeobacter sp. B1627]|uniref:DeoR/GlpR family DNA-binding transcription regulator n=1 Tax=Phaeobacter sp. B1627 TaxID=2583809 RepID=UPI00111A571F|nr:DeoR/GlpR family DNA-binding transcription regulator [Phaeobacter sp. B1627]TNJ47805.1 DeoR/GlpR transcriptional regulator [Phaeobacter sp. B1627]